jgi:CHAT domain-containing protein
MKQIMRFRSFHLAFCTSIALFLSASLSCDGKNVAIAQSSATQIYQQGQEEYQSGKFQAAIRLWQQAIILYQQNGDRLREGYALANIGFAHNNMNNYNLAAEAHLQSITIAREISDLDLEALGLYGLGSAYAGQGNYPQAIAEYQKSLTIARKTNYRRTEAQVLRAMAESYKALSKYAEAIEFYQQSLKLAEEIDFRERGRILSGLGALYRQIGKYAEAINAYQQSIEIARQVPDRANEASALLGLGNVYFAMGDPNLSVQYWRESLTIAREIDDSALKTIVEEALQAATSEDLIARAREGGDRDLEAYGFESQGIDSQNRRDYPQALAAYQQGLTIFRELGNREREGEILSYIGQVLSEQNQTELAIIFLKQSIKVYESIRKDNQVLPKDLQESYTLTVADSYRRLADLLLKSDRILEAQQILDLLKVQELRTFTGVRAKVTAAGIVYTTAEEQVIQAHDTLIAFGQTVQKCEREKCNQLNQLYGRRQALTQEFNQTAQSFAQAIRDRRAQDTAMLDPEDLTRSAQAIVNAQPGTVLIYPLVLEDKLWLLWVTQGGVVNSIEVPVTQQQLGSTIIRFRQLLKTPAPANIPELQATAKQLYTWLIAPLEPELKANHIQHLVFSLDRATRYIPMAALFDGKQYLVENYTISTVLSADLTNMSDRLPAPANTQAIAFGLSQATADFPSLPNVPNELNAIIRQNASDPQGFYNGLQFLDRAFTRNSLRDNLIGHQILHIATHGEFIPGRRDESFLILGTGEKLRVAEINDMQQVFQDIKLVVLSACQTALGEPDQDGIEVNGIAYYFLNSGASAVMASLWNVNDASTSQLMQQFYHHLTASPQTGTQPKTKAEALRNAQISMITGNSEALEDTQRRLFGARLRDRPLSDIPAPGGDRLSHPYYWSPFILIGNGL